MNNIIRIKNRIYYLKLTYVPNLKGREFFLFLLFILYFIFFKSLHQALCRRHSPVSSAHTPVSCSSLTHGMSTHHFKTRSKLSVILYFKNDIVTIICDKFTSTNRRLQLRLLAKWKVLSNVQTWLAAYCVSKKQIKKNYRGASYTQRFTGTSLVVSKYNSESWANHPDHKWSTIHDWKACCLGECNFHHVIIY